MKGWREHRLRSWNLEYQEEVRRQRRLREKRYRAANRASADSYNLRQRDFKF